MEFPEIVSMIDADLELLHKVRQLLDPTSLPPGMAPTVKVDRKRATRIQVPMNDFISAAAELAARPEVNLVETPENPGSTSELLSEATEPVLVSSRPRSSRRRSEGVLEPGALRGPVPVGPVFVPAHGAGASRPTVVVRKTVVETAPALTAEAVARQWFSR